MDLILLKLQNNPARKMVIPHFKEDEAKAQRKCSLLRSAKSGSPEPDSGLMIRLQWPSVHSSALIPPSPPKLLKQHLPIWFQEYKARGNQMGVLYHFKPHCFSTFRLKSWHLLHGPKGSLWALFVQSVFLIARHDVSASSVEILHASGMCLLSPGQLYTQQIQRCKLQTQSKSKLWRWRDGSECLPLKHEDPSWDPPIPK